MSYTLADLEDAQRNVEDGEKRLAAQWQLIEHLTMQSHSTAEAEEVLSHMLVAMDAMRRRLREIEDSVRIQCS